MFLVWIVTGILATIPDPLPLAVEVWHWFGVHWLLTVLMLVFLA